MFIRRSSGGRAITSRPDTGQGLVEYALILVLVAIIVIAVLTLLGEDIGAVFCKITVSIGGDITGNTSCPNPVVNCVGGPNPEALVYDDKNQIQKVEFYVNGVLKVTELHYHYCMGTGNTAPCPNYPLAPGDRVTMIAYDQDGNTGQCGFTK